MKKERIRKQWVACMLSLLTFFVLFSVSSVLSDTDSIQANLVVIPTEKAFCFPQTFVVKEALGNITCFIEVKSATPDIINVSSLRLGISENPAAGIPPLGTPTFINDFNNNGVKDLFVQFDFSQFKNLFSSLNLPGNYHYRIDGNINIIPFSFQKTSSVFAKFNVPSPSRGTKLIDYISEFKGTGGNIVVASGFRLSKFTQETNILDGYVVQRVSYPDEGVRSWGNIIYSSRGFLTVDFTIFPWLPPFFSMNVREALTVVDDGFHSCSSTTNDIVICQSSGVMIKQGSGIFADVGNVPIKTLIYIISPQATKIFGFDSNNNKILEVQNISLSYIKTPNFIPEFIQPVTQKIEFENGIIGNHSYFTGDTYYPKAENRTNTSNGKVIVFASGDPGESITTTTSLTSGTYSVYISYELCGDSEPMGVRVGQNPEVVIVLNEPSFTGCPGGNYIKRDNIGTYTFSEDSVVNVTIRSLDGTRCSNFPITMCWFFVDYVEFVRV